MADPLDYFRRPQPPRRRPEWGCLAPGATLIAICLLSGVYSNERFGPFVCGFWLGVLVLLMGALTIVISRLPPPRR